MHLKKASLRPALKALILGLLPAIEEEAGEDFDRAFQILHKLEEKFVSDLATENEPSNLDGYFWQSLFLCMITSPSRRQGALHYLLRRLPKLDGPVVAPGDANESCGPISREIELVLTPEPGLLVRCFVAGLSDSQVLTQRGCLDLLVTTLPLKSAILREKILQQDLDNLVSAAIHVLLRKEMSLNRRLWSWFLGPEPKDQQVQSPSPHVSKEISSSVQYEYFTEYGEEPLMRVLLHMLKNKTSTPADMARPFRILSSLMDRWEIGGTIVPRIFGPALDSVFAFQLTASQNDITEVLRSASLFFDGVEASLIWETFCEIIQKSISHGHHATERLQLLKWTLDNFNVQDEEMITVHAPLAFLLFLHVLKRPSVGNIDDSVSQVAFDILKKLLDIIPSRVFSAHDDGCSQTNIGVPSNADLERQIMNFYQEQQKTSDKVSLPFDRANLTQFALDQTVQIVLCALKNEAQLSITQIIPILQGLLVKSPNVRLAELAHLKEAMLAYLSLTEEGDTIEFVHLSSIVSLLTTLKSTERVSADDLMLFRPSLSKRIWHFMSPYLPKYQVEAVRMLWQLEALLASEGAIQVSLLGLLRGEPSSISNTVDLLSEESVGRFAVLWSHTVSTSQNKQSSFGLLRRASISFNVTDAGNTTRRLQILAEPLMLILDILHDPTSKAFDTVRSWLATLSSLDQVFSILLQRLESVAGAPVARGISSSILTRNEADRRRGLVYMLGHFEHLLQFQNGWMWESLTAATSNIDGDASLDGTVLLAQCCTGILSDARNSWPDLDRRALAVLKALIIGPGIPEMQKNLETILMDKLLRCLSEDEDTLQGLLLDLIPKAIRKRLATNVETPSGVHRPRQSFGSKQHSIQSPGVNGSTFTSFQRQNTSPTPPSQLLQCIEKGFGSKSARAHMDQWLQFLDSVLPIFADTIFASLLPLVDGICRELEKVFAELVALTIPGPTAYNLNPENTCFGLLEALEMILSRAHDCLIVDSSAESISQVLPQPKGILGTVTAGVFKTDGPPSKTAQANSRLTVILAFQDSIKICLKIWAWSSHAIDSSELDQTCVATTVYTSMHLRNKTRHLLEQMFAVEPLESLEVIIENAFSSPTQIQAATSLNLLQVMHGCRPKNILPAILDALCCRVSAAGLQTGRQSSKTANLTATEISVFLLDYLNSVEDDAMDEVWSDCVAFLRDVLANPLPYRQVLAPLLSLVHLLVQKLSNTNFGEQRKMRRELGDIFQRLLAATLTTVPSNFLATVPVEPDSETTVDRKTSSDDKLQRANDLIAVLAELVADLEAIVETTERIAAVVNNISSSLVAPTMHSKAFPANITRGFLDLLLQLERMAPTAKLWKKEIGEGLNDPKLFSTSVQLMETGWFPLLRQWILRDKDRMPDLLARLTPPSSAGIMFGVGASAARLETDRRTQLNLRRICLLLLACPPDTWAFHLRDFDEKLQELWTATESSSPSSSIKAELFLLCRALVLSLSPIHLSPLWPGINQNLQAALTTLMPGNHSARNFSNLGVLQGCKLLDQLVVLSPEEFQLHEWLYIADSVDAVYQPPGWTSSGLADLVAETLRSDQLPDDDELGAQLSTPHTSNGHRQLLLSESSFDRRDVKALTRDDFAKLVARPFLSQLSIHAYEGVYSMQPPDIQSCRRDLLHDILDLSTIVD